MRLAALLLLFAVNSYAALTVDVRSKSVTVNGATPKGEVAIVYGEFTDNQWTVQRSFGSTHISVDESGTAVFRPGNGISSRSVWGVVDVATGEWLFATPRGYYAQRLPAAASKFKRGVDETITEIEQMGHGAEILVVRPSEAAWTQLMYDGVNDDDGKGDGKLKIAFTGMKALIGTEESPKHLRDGDVVLMIDTTNLFCGGISVSKGGRQ